MAECQTELASGINKHMNFDQGNGGTLKTVCTLHAVQIYDRTVPIEQTFVHSVATVVNSVDTCLCSNYDYLQKSVTQSVTKSVTKSATVFLEVGEK